MQRDASVGAGPRDLRRRSLQSSVFAIHCHRTSSTTLAQPLHYRYLGFRFKEALSVGQEAILRYDS